MSNYYYYTTCTVCGGLLSGNDGSSAPRMCRCPSPTQARIDKLEREIAALCKELHQVYVKTKRWRCPSWIPSSRTCVEAGDMDKLREQLREAVRSTDGLEHKTNDKQQ